MNLERAQSALHRRTALVVLPGGGVVDQEQVADLLKIGVAAGFLGEVLDALDAIERQLDVDRGRELVADACN